MRRSSFGPEKREKSIALAAREREVAMGGRNNRGKRSSMTVARGMQKARCMLGAEKKVAHLYRSTSTP